MDEVTFMPEDDNYFDDMYPRDGAVYQVTEPVEQKKERNLEKSKVMAALPLINELIERIQKRITFYDTVSSITVDAGVESGEFLRQWHANQQTKANLEEEREWIVSLRDTYK